MATEADINLKKIEAILTEEQKLRDTVARKRRNFTKKRNRTPMRKIDVDQENFPIEDEEINNNHEDDGVDPPKIPERKQRKSCNGVSRNGSETSSNSLSGSFKENKRKLRDLAQEELRQIFNKTKKSLTEVAGRGRDRFKKEDFWYKRSKSAPFEQEDLQKYQHQRKLSETLRNSQESLVSFDDFSSKTLRPEVQNFIRHRKKQRRASEKVIQVLDPKTSEVLSTKTVIVPHDFNLINFLKILPYFSLKEIFQQFRLFLNQTRFDVRKMKLLRNSCMMELFLLLIYCGCGSLIFKFTEGHFESFYKCGVKRVKRDFIDLLWLKSHNLREEDWKSLARTKLRNFEEELHAAHEAGMMTYSGMRSWSFLNGIVYTLSVVTTIGYGHIYPTTTTGKALTIVYSIIGIPLFLIVLTDFGKLFTRGIKFLWSFVRRLYYTGHCRKVRKTAHVQEIFKGAQMMYEIATFRRPSFVTDEESQAHPSSLQRQESQTQQPSTESETPTSPNISNFEIDDEFNLPISLALFILITYILIGAVLYSVWEGWKFFSAFYFVFISMSTTGFGDMVPKDPICMIVSIVYLVFGLALMSMCINVVQEKLSVTFRKASMKIGMSMGLEVSEMEGEEEHKEDGELARVHWRQPGEDKTGKSGKEEEKSPSPAADDQGKSGKKSSSPGTDHQGKGGKKSSSPGADDQGKSGKNKSPSPGKK